MENIIFLFLSPDLITAIVVAVLGGGLFFGIAAFRKAKPEMSKITVEIAGQAVIVQKGVIDSLQNELIRQGADLVALEAENKKLGYDLRAVERENEKCQKENAEFRRVIGELEVKLTNHAVRMDKIEETKTNKE